MSEIMEPSPSTDSLEYALRVAVAALPVDQRVAMAELCLKGWKFRFVHTELGNDDKFVEKFVCRGPYSLWATMQFKPAPLSRLVDLASMWDDDYNNGPHSALTGHWGDVIESAIKW